ncbi:transcriptional regulator [Pseudomonas sp. CCM 7891]|uniref:Transcriptional regulator n=1 Tax=Pseudomonas karstica TaxID=1055468 RepID=A0A7X2RSW0_9PSED|nr:transcriptional regulator [Pseudomonas karstica]MTD19941.1 transcriptional regulator [Pseudomonas karstica]
MTSIARLFQDTLVSGNDAHQVLSQGIQLRRLNAGAQTGLALQIAREVLQPGQLQRVLERRFEQALMFDGCFIYLDTQGALVIWHALPAQPLDTDRLDVIIHRLLSLANLEALNVSRHRY